MKTETDKTDEPVINETEQVITKIEPQGILEKAEPQPVVEKLEPEPAVERAKPQESCKGVTPQTVSKDFRPGARALARKLKKHQLCQELLSKRKDSCK